MKKLDVDSKLSVTVNRGGATFCLRSTLIDSSTGGLLDNFTFQTQAQVQGCLKLDSFQTAEGIIETDITVNDEVGLLEVELRAQHEGDEIIKKIRVPLVSILKALGYTRNSVAEGSTDCRSDEEKIREAEEKSIVEGRVREIFKYMNSKKIKTEKPESASELDIEKGKDEDIMTEHYKYLDQCLIPKIVEATLQTLNKNNGIKNAVNGLAVYWQRPWAQQLAEQAMRDNPTYFIQNIQNYIAAPWLPVTIKKYCVQEHTVVLKNLDYFKHQPWAHEIIDAIMDGGVDIRPYLDKIATCDWGDAVMQRSRDHHNELENIETIQKRIIEWQKARKPLNDESRRLLTEAANLCPDFFLSITPTLHHLDGVDYLIKDTFEKNPGLKLSDDLLEHRKKVLDRIKSREESAAIVPDKSNTATTISDPKRYAENCNYFIRNGFLPEVTKALRFIAITKPQIILETVESFRDLPGAYFIVDSVAAENPEAFLIALKKIHSNNKRQNDWGEMPWVGDIVFRIARSNIEMVNKYARSLRGYSWYADIRKKLDEVKITLKSGILFW